MALSHGVINKELFRSLMYEVNLGSYDADEVSTERENIIFRGMP